MVDLREGSRERELALLLDVGRAGNSSQACQLVDEFVEKIADHSVGVLVDLNAGELLLTRGVLSKMMQQIQKAGAVVGTVYSSVPQTQQAALDEGLYVKEKLSSQWAPIRQALPLQNPPKMGEVAAAGKNSVSLPAEKTLATKPSPSRRLGVDLPKFGDAARDKVRDFTPIAPQSLDIPEMAAPEVEVPAEVNEPAGVEPSLSSLPADLPASVSAALIAADITDEAGLSDTAFETLYIRQTMRSGQTIRFNGNVVVVGDVHAGSEITAGGDILVWGELRGIAHAGAQGNFKAEIRAMKIEALQLRIAEYIARRPDRVFYHKDGTETVISPEVARVADGEIKIFKTMLSRG